MKICGIYKITSPSGRVYIGQSKSCLDRAKIYRRSEAKSQRFLHASIKKYGWASHEFKIIWNCHPDKLNYFEKIFISLYKSFGTNTGMNLDAGGSSGSVFCSQSLIEKRRAINIGNKYALGKKHSKEARQNHRLAVLGEKHPMFGKQTPEHVKEKIRAKTKGRKKSETARINISKNHFKRSVEQYTLSGELVKIWSSAKEASCHGFNFTAIHNVCKKFQGRKTHANFTWKYA